MDTKEELIELENQVANVRYELMLKGSQLYSMRQNVNADNLENLEKLDEEVGNLRMQLLNLSSEIRKLKFTYYVTYQVSFKNMISNQDEREIYHETLWLNHDLNVDLHAENDWMLDKPKVNELLLDLLSYLNHKYDEVTILRVKRM